MVIVLLKKNKIYGDSLSVNCFFVYYQTALIQNNETKS